MKITVSGVNPSDVKSRRGRPLTWPRIIPHSDGAGLIDAVGEGSRPSPHRRAGVAVERAVEAPVRNRAEYVALPAEQAVKLPDGVEFAAGACLGIPALTALQAVGCMARSQARRCWSPAARAAVGHYAIADRRRAAPG